MSDHIKPCVMVYNWSFCGPTRKILWCRNMNGRFSLTLNIINNHVERPATIFVKTYKSRPLLILDVD